LYRWELTQPDRRIRPAHGFQQSETVTPDRGYYGASRTASPKFDLLSVIRAVGESAIFVTLTDQISGPYRFARLAMSVGSR